MFTVDEITEIVCKCEFAYPYENWQIVVKTDHTRPYLQVYVPNGRDSETGLPAEWTGRKWMLSPFMCKNEIVTTAFKAVMTAMEHEVREQFRYRGVAIFNPHLDPDRMVEFASNPDNIQVRDDVVYGV